MLTEAAVLTSDPDVVGAAREFVIGLANNLDPIDRAYLAKCKKLYRKPIWLPGIGMPGRKATDDWAYAVMREIHSPVAYRAQHGHFISLSEHSDAMAAAYLWLEDGATGIGTARLRLHPADDIEQAKAFYSKVDLAELNGLSRLLINA